MRERERERYGIEVQTDTGQVVAGPICWAEGMIFVTRRRLKATASNFVVFMSNFNRHVTL